VSFSDSIERGDVNSFADSPVLSLDSSIAADLPMTAAAADVTNKYIAMYSLPVKERVVYVLPCTFQGALFGQADK
jgi:hypothetical protein